MSLKFGISLPQGWTMELANMKDPVEAYETMTQVADEVGFESPWLVDHFHTIPKPSQEITQEDAKTRQAAMLIGLWPAWFSLSLHSLSAG